MYQSLIFDIDGTLLNSDQAILMAFQKVLLKETGQEHSIEMLTSLMGMTSVNSLTKLGVLDVAQANAKILQYLRRFFHLMGLYSGIEDVLQQMKKKKVHIGIVTSKTREESQQIFFRLARF